MWHFLILLLLGTLVAAGAATPDCREMVGRMTSDGKPAVTYEALKKSQALVEMDPDTRAEWNREMRDLFDKLYPNHDWEKEPIEFVLVDSSQPNAFHAFVEGKHYIGFTKGLILGAKSQDLLAWVLGHEYRHLRLQEDLGEGANSKGEEAICDAFPLKALADAGFDPSVALDFFSPSPKESSFLSTLLRMIDPHPDNNLRLAVVEAELTRIKNTRGLPDKNPWPSRTETSATLRDLVKPHHAVLSAGSKKKRKKSETIISAVYDDEELEQSFRRLKSMASRVSKAEMSREDKVALGKSLHEELVILNNSSLDENHKNMIYDSVDSLLQAIWNDPKAYFPFKVTRKQGQHVELEELLDSTKDRPSFVNVVAQTVKLLGLTEPLKELKSLSDEFAKSETEADALRLAQQISGLVSANRSQLKRLLERGNFLPTMGFKLPGKVRQYEKKDYPNTPVPWQRYMEWAAKDSTGTIRSTLIQLGVKDSRLMEQMSDSEVMRFVINPLFIANPHHMSRRTSWESSDVAAFALELDKEGRILAAKKEKFVIEETPALMLFEAGRKRLKKLGEKLYRQALAGNEKSARYLQLLGDSGMLQELGQNHLFQNPALYFKVNQAFYDDPRNRNAANKLISLLSRLEDHAESVPAERPAVRSIVLDYIQRLHLRDAARDFGEFVLRDPFHLFSHEEKIKFIEENGIYPLNQEIGTYQRNLWSRSLGIEPSDPQANLLPRLAELEKLKAVEVSPYIHNEDHPSFIDLAQAAEIVAALDAKPPSPKVDLSAALKYLPDWVLKRNEGFRKSLAVALEGRVIWPSESKELIELASRLTRFRLFPTDGKLETELLGRASEHLVKETDLDLRRQGAEKILSSNASEWPAIRARATKIWIESTLANSRDPQTGEVDSKKVLGHLDGFIDKITHRDKYFLIRDLAEESRSQEEFSKQLANRSSGLTRKALEGTQAGGVLLEATLLLSRQDVPVRDAMLRFLLEPVSVGPMNHLIQESDRAIRVSFDDSPSGGAALSAARSKLQAMSEAEKMRDFEKVHVNFWDAPLEGRAVMMREILLPRHSNASIQHQIFMGGLDFVLRELFPGAEPYSKEARNILVKYALGLPELDRPLFVAAAMAAVERSRQAGQRTVGKRLAYVLEMMGPAEIKLGQAIHSFERTPEDIRADMSLMKHDVDAPTRWELFELLKKTLPTELSDKIEQVEERLGAASYYYVYRVKLKDGQEMALALLKDHARARSELGFQRMEGLLKAMSAEKGNEELSRALAELVDQAKRMAAIETDWNMSKSQSERAEAMYRDRKVFVNGQTFDFNPARSLEIGPGYRLMELAAGRHYNDLPTEEKDAKQFKRSLGLAYHTLELSNLLSGKPFDEDRHGSQMKVKGNSATLYDFGALKLDEPAKEELQSFGQILYRLQNVLETTKADSTSSEAGLAQVFLDESRSYRESGKPNTDYLLSIHKAWLAMTDYRKDFAKADYQDMFASVLEHGQIHPEIMKGFVGEMSAKEKTKALFAAKRKSPIKILK